MRKGRRGNLWWVAFGLGMVCGGVWVAWVTTGDTRLFVAGLIAAVVGLLIEIREVRR